MEGVGEVGAGPCDRLPAHTDAGGERAALIYSLAETAELDGLDPQAFLREVPMRRADRPVNRIDVLRPWNIARHALDQRREEQRLAARGQRTRAPQRKRKKA